MAKVLDTTAYLDTVCALLREGHTHVPVTVAGTKDAVMMVEAGAKEITEEEMLGAILFAHEEIKKICAFIQSIQDEIAAVEKAQKNAEELQSSLMSYSRERYYNTFTLRLIDIEILKKFALSIACFIFFFIGAPLGAIIRKGGLGTPIVISVFFFVVYYIIMLTGEKASVEGQWSAVMGMWISSIVLAPIAIYLTYKATNDSSLLDIDWYYGKYKHFTESLKSHLPRKWQERLNRKK